MLIIVVENIKILLLPNFIEKKVRNIIEWGAIVLYFCTVYIILLFPLIPCIINIIINSLLFMGIMMLDINSNV